MLEQEEVLLLHLAAPLQPGELRLTLAYTGLLDDSMRGFYRTKHSEVCDQLYCSHIGSALLSDYNYLAQPQGNHTALIMIILGPILPAPAAVLSN